MRVSRIRKFKKSGEITIVLTEEEAKGLSFRLYHDRCELIHANDIKNLEYGTVLGKELYYQGLKLLW